MNNAFNVSFVAVIQIITLFISDLRLLYILKARRSIFCTNSTLNVSISFLKISKFDLDKNNFLCPKAYFYSVSSLHFC